MSIANLSAEDRKNMEEQIKDRRPTYQHYGPVEDMSENDIRVREAQVKASRSEVKPTYQHYGSVEDMSEEQIQGLEAQIRARNHEVEPIYQHYGSVENMDEESRKALEAHVAEKRKEDLPHEKYFDALDESLTITDEEQFETAVARSIQSNQIMRDFTSNLVGKISGAVHELKGMDGVDKENPQSNYFWSKIVTYWIYFKCFYCINLFCNLHISDFRRNRSSRSRPNR